MASDSHNDVRSGEGNRATLLAAPGVEILTTAPPHAYAFLSGTSLAAAHVSGVVALMMRARVPVIPVAILGTYRLLPRHANFFRAARVTVRFGQPIAPPGEALARDGVREYAQRIMDAIHALGAPR